MSMFDGLWRYVPANGSKERIPAALQREVVRYIEAPSLAGWQDIRNHRISRRLTLHDIVDHVDRCYETYPSGILVARALRYRREAEETRGELLKDRA